MSTRQMRKAENQSAENTDNQEHQETVSGDFAEQSDQVEQQQPEQQQQPKRERQRDNVTGAKKKDPSALFNRSSQPLNNQEDEVELKIFKQHLDSYANTMKPALVDEKVTLAAIHQLDGAVKSFLRLRGKSLIEAHQHFIKTVRSNLNSAFKQPCPFLHSNVLKGEEYRRTYASLVTLYLRAAKLDNPTEVKEHHDLNRTFMYVKDQSDREQFLRLFS